MRYRFLTVMLALAAVAAPGGEVWRALSGSTGVTPLRYKSAPDSQRWQWGPGDRLLCEFPAVKISGETDCFGVWLYQAVPHSGRLTVTFFHGDRKLAQVWYNLDFRNWRPLGARYGELGLKPGTMVDRIEFTAPADGEEGEFFLDSLRACFASRALNVDEQQPWIGKPELLRELPEKTRYSAADISVNRPWLPPFVAAGAMSPESKREVARLTAYFPSHPVNDKDLPDSDPAQFERDFAALGIRERDGVISGPPLEFAFKNTIFLTEPGAVDFKKQLLPLFRKLGHALRNGSGDSRRRAVEIALTLCRYMLDQGYMQGNGNLGWSGNGYEYRYFPPMIFRLHDQLAAAGMLDDMARMVAWLSCGSKVFLAEPNVSCDELYNYASQLPASIAQIPDLAQRYQYFRALKLFYDRVILNTTPFGADGTIHHHGGHHLAYGSYAAPMLVRSQLLPLEGGEFAISSEAKARLYLQARALAFQLMNGRTAPNLPMRAGTPLAIDNAPLTLALSAMDTPEREMASLYLTALDGRETPEAKAFIAAGVKPKEPTGHLTLNLAAAAIHRRGNWMVNAVGMRNAYRGLEIYGWLENNNYGRFCRNGSVFVTVDGKDGFDEAGWNWNFWPGATSVLRPSTELFDGYTMYGNVSEFAGGVTASGGNGVWGMDFKGNDVNFKKSVFFFDNRVTVITTDIAKANPRPADSPGGAVVTTLFQQSSVHGAKPAQTADTLRDPLGNGYYIWPDNPRLVTRQGRQEWTYFFRRYLRNPDDNPVTDIRRRQFRAKPLKANAGYYTPTGGEFALAYFDFADGKRRSCVYTLLVGADDAALTAFAADPRTDILMRNGRAHVLHDRETGTTGYVVFNAVSPLKGVLRKISRPAFATVRDCGDSYEVSVAVSDPADLSPLKVELVNAEPAEIPVLYPNTNTVCIPKKK